MVDDDVPLLKRHWLGFPVWIYGAAALASMVVLASAVIIGIAIYLSRSKSADEGARASSATKSDTSGDAVQDYQTYTNTLRDKIPLYVDKLPDTGYKAEKYTKDESNGLFRELTIVVPPVFLTDKLTGKTLRYTRAHLVRNNPAPPQVDRHGFPVGYADHYRWVKVEMLP